MHEYERLTSSFVGDTFVDGGTSMILIDPSRGIAAHEVRAAGANVVDAAVRAAQDAQREWMRRTAPQRGAALHRWADAIVEHADELARLDILTVGRAIRDAAPEARAIAAVPRFWAGMADKIQGHQVPAINGHLSYVSREPLGVIGIILPWNGPMAAFVEKTSVALACGNAVVVKPSELSPLSALRLAELSVGAGMPPGLVNVVLGDGEVGSQVASHTRIAGVTFTGSVATGRRIAHAAADRFARTTLELGGKSPNIVFPDADLASALHGTAWGVFYNAGQVCCSGTRLLVHADISDAFIDAMRARMERVRVGDPLDPNNHIGPVVSAPQFDRVRGLLDRARDAGALVEQGSARDIRRDEGGYFCEPTLVLHADPESEIAQQEVFGPVLTVIPFSTEDEALTIANGVEYGLSAKVWTSDVGRMLRMAHALEAGSIWGNTAQVGSPALPFSGFKNSGMGTSSGLGAIDGVTRAKAVSIRYDDDSPAPGWDDLTS